ncbi:ABC transporter permease [Marinobacter nanhaiticus D15-8W]|uniref:ABC transporter permease n=1 Tax=Marinobacter nanhaiticus D15-8W TaxID=626887 RepID=N6W3Y9_9GAMM|nr:ABC transporter permease [Marinobacter nanhaiticus]ENO14864.1 ABC transporter permease [Marinobacter nanhaiticus D15-8W]BES69442.1 ABC transporter permease [Marinobacter nanhaiticus D15-8W]
MLSLERRPVDSKTMTYASPVLALVLTIVTGFLIFLGLDRDPIEGLRHFFITPINSSYGWAELGLKMAPLLLCAAGLTICYRAKLWNIGAEGHFLMGAVGASIVALQPGGGSGFWILPLVLLAGVAFGALWAAIAAFLKTHFHCNEILTTIMLNYIALNLLLYGVHGPLKDPYGFSFPQSAMFGDSALLPMLIPGTRLHIGLLFAVLAAVIVGVLFARTFIGFQLKVLGEDEQAAAFAGFPRKKLIWFAFLVAGGMAGLAGASEVTGPIGQLVPQVSPGYGYTAIIVVFLGRMKAVGIILASALLALTFLGGEMMQISMNLPKAMTGLFQGLLLFYLLTCDAFIHYRVRWIGSRPAVAKITLAGQEG